MVFIEKIFLFASIPVCALSSVLLILGWIFEKKRLFIMGRGLTWVFLATVTATIAVRWHYQGHGPYITMYEVFLSNVWIATLIYLVFFSRKKGLDVLGVFAMPIILLIMGAVVMSPAQISYLTPSYRSVWLMVHVLFAKLTYGSILMATALSISVLFHRYGNPEKNRYIQRLSDPEQADILSYKLIVSALFFASIMIISGSIWANQLWGKYWGWDPIEVWSLVTWIVYGLYLHLRITYKFKGVPAAIYIILGFFLSVFSFFIMPYVLPTVHNSFMFAK
ncbi:MAG: ResC/HemX-like cytochrome c bioproteinis membrane [Geobacteraceae bacterium]|nr:MAG: ResC/HemX-like cytochrome c bioproteinis membrane [Geobacteraceae bacterium]